VQKGDIVRVRLDEFRTKGWAGSEGVLQYQHPSTGNWEIKIFRSGPNCPESSKQFQTWGEQDLEIITENDNLEMYERRIYWEEQLG
jgi:hypothetical protein